MKVIRKIVYSQNPIAVSLKNIKVLRDIYIKRFKKFDDKIYISLVMHCNLNCSYCLNKVFGKIHLAKPLPAKDWIKIINREKKKVALSGGEPALYPELIELINGIDKDIEIELMTNLKWADEFIEKYLKEINRPVVFYASYHEGFEKERFLHVLNKLKNAHKFRGSVHAISINKKRDSELKKWFAKHGVHIGIDEDMRFMYDGCSQKFKKKVICSRKNYIVAPNADRFRCVSYMIRNLPPIENIKEQRLSDAVFTAPCPEYGYCAPCDLMGDTKIKELE